MSGTEYARLKDFKSLIHGPALLIRVRLVLISSSWTRIALGDILHTRIQSGHLAAAHTLHFNLSHGPGETQTKPMPLVFRMDGNLEGTVGTSLMLRRNDRLVTLETQT